MRRGWIGAALAAAGVFAASGADADENMFGYTYGSETLPKGANEAYVWVTHRSGKAGGSYAATDTQFEIEHGFTDRFQASGYLNFESHSVSGLQPAFQDVHRGVGFSGVQAEFKYAILSPYKDPIGLAVYVEPAYGRIDPVSGERNREFEVETKLILQKNFLEDRLIWAGNLSYEQDFEKSLDAGSDWEKEAAFEVSTGVSYRIAPNWFAGLEARYHSVFPDFPHTVRRGSEAVFLGPNLHYAAKRWWVTAAWLPQVAGSPQAPGRTLELVEHERNEFRLKFGYEF